MYNLPVDIIQIIDEIGTSVVECTYDAWGKVLNVTGDDNLKNTLGKIQPFRYRGYVYDVETGLYYLRSRYYSCYWLRFLNVDQFLVIQNSLGANTYSYCLNDSINHSDPLGTDAAAVWSSTMWWLIAIDGALPIGDVIYWSVFAAMVCSGIEQSINDSSTLPQSILFPSVALSESINWLEANSNHIMKGSKNHEPHDWSSFGIDPNDPDGWEKLLPILKKVVDTGFEMTRNNTDNGRVIHYCRDYINEGVTVVVKLFINNNGTLDFSDAWTIPLK